MLYAFLAESLGVVWPCAVACGVPFVVESVSLVVVRGCTRSVWFGCWLNTGRCVCWEVSVVLLPIPRVSAAVTAVPSVFHPGAFFICNPPFVVTVLLYPRVV